MDENVEKRGWTKILAGIFLMIAGSAGWIFGKRAKERTLRISILLLSAISLGAGFYLFVSGSTDIALGVVGQYQLNGPRVQTMTFPGPDYLKLSLEKTIVQKDLRRLQYVCPDGSKSFTIYRTLFGIFGIPSKSVTCADGFKLLDYDSSKGFVMEIQK